MGPDGRKVDAQGDTVMQEGEGEEGGISVGEDFQAELPQYRGPKLELHEVHLPTQRAELAKMGHPGPTEAEVCAEVVRVSGVCVVGEGSGRGGECLGVERALGHS